MEVEGGLDGAKLMGTFNGAKLVGFRLGVLGPGLAEQGAEGGAGFDYEALREAEDGFVDGRKGAVHIELDRGAEGEGVVAVWQVGLRGLVEGILGTAGVCQVRG